MLENRLSENRCDVKANQDSRLSDLAWKPEIIAEGKISQVKVAPATMGLSRRTENDKLKSHIPVNDRCSLDIYDHHWELTMPKVTVPVINGGLRMNSNGKLELVGTLGKEVVTHEKLMMDDKGIWTMRDDQGQSVEVDKEGIVYEPLDPKHPEKKIPVKHKVFTNDTTVKIREDGTMTLTRDQDHVYESRRGTPEFDQEKMANRFTAEFNKKDGLIKVIDQNKVWPIRKTTDLK